MAEIPLRLLEVIERIGSAFRLLHPNGEAGVEEIEHAPQASESILILPSKENNKMPLFAEALGRVQEALRREGHRHDVIWVFREDISITKGGQVWLRLPVPGDNYRLVQDLYEMAMAENRVVQFSLFCTYNGHPCCFILVPKTPVDAENRMIYEFKISILKNPPSARALRRGSFIWLLYLFSGGSQPDWYLDEVPSRYVE